MLKWNMLEKRQNISIVEIYAHENAEYVKCYNIEKAMLVQNLRCSLLNIVSGDIGPNLSTSSK